MRPREKSEWLKPGTILTLAGLLASIVIAWMNLDARVTKNETKTEAIGKDIDSANGKLDKIIDRLIDGHEKK